MGCEINSYRGIKDSVTDDDPSIGSVLQLVHSFKQAQQQCGLIKYGNSRVSVLTMGRNDMVILYYVKSQKVTYRNMVKSAQQIENIKNAI